MTDKVDKPLMESLSALIDGEASELELRRVLKSGTELEVRAAWQRYQLAGALMRGECHAPLEAQQAGSFATRVLAAIEAEDRGEPLAIHENVEQADAGVSSARRYAFAGLGKVAIAASVTLAMVLGFNQFALNDTQGVSGSAELASMSDNENHPGDTSAVVPEGYRVPSLSAMTVSSVAGGSSPSRYRDPVRALSLPVAPQASDSAEINADLQAQIQRMLILHSEKASDEVGLTIVPGSRLSSQDIPKE